MAPLIASGASAGNRSRRRACADLILRRIAGEHRLEVVMRVDRRLICVVIVMGVMLVCEHPPHRLQINLPGPRAPSDGEQDGEASMDSSMDSICSLHGGVFAPAVGIAVQSSLTSVAMLFLVVKYAVTALVIVIVSEVAKRSDRAGALIASLPLVTVMAMIWLHVEKQPEAKIANHAYYTFWYVLPTMPMFLLVPWMMNRGVSFWLSLFAGCALTIGCFGVAAIVLKRFGIGLLP